MNWLKVESTAIDSIAYDEPTKTLQVKFKNQSIYTYKGVDKLVVQNLIKAPSKRTFLANFIHGKHGHTAQAPHPHHGGTKPKPHSNHEKKPKHGNGKNKK